jgi:hypothetical protein
LGPIVAVQQLISFAIDFLCNPFRPSGRPSTNYVFDLHNAFTRTAADSTRQLFDINSHTVEKVVKRQVELTINIMESAVKQSVSHGMEVK